jgi:membrane-associated protease RseP (regulator of RpoE activity)
MRRLRGQAGQATIEFAGMTFWLLLAALFVWQSALVGWSFVSATNAARTAARLYSRTGDQSQAIDDAKKSLSGVLSSGANISFAGDRAEVSVDIPLFLPGLDPGLSAHGTALMPHTG